MFILRWQDVRIGKRDPIELSPNHYDEMQDPLQIHSCKAPSFLCTIICDSSISPTLEIPSNSKQTLQCVRCISTSPTSVSGRFSSVLMSPGNLRFKLGRGCNCEGYVSESLTSNCIQLSAVFTLIGFSVTCTLHGCRVSPMRLHGVMISLRCF